MKKLVLVLTMVMSILLLAACAKDNKKSEDTSDAQKDAAQTENVAEGEDTATNEDTEVTEEPGDTDVNKDTDASEKIDINIAALKGPTAIGMVKVMDDAKAGNTANNYNFTIAGTPDEISTALIKGDIDVAAVPCNLASVLYNKTEGAVKLAGINTLGVLYIVETGDTIKSVEDLKGKTIYSTGLGTTPQYTLNYLLTANGIDPEKDVTIEYKTEATEVAALLEKSTDAVAMLPQPYVTTVMMKNDKVRIALNVAEEWDAVSTDGSSVVTGVVIVRSDFLEKNKEAFDTFLDEYTNSTAYVNAQVDEASALVEKFDIFQAEPMKKAIPYCNITLIRGEEMKEKVGGYLTALFNQEPKSVGGKLPDDNFYYLP
jgi:NitT/TauT family transport system substrate-binding protein